MKRTLKNWSLFWLYLGILSTIILVVSLFIDVSILNSVIGLCSFVVILLVGIIVGFIIFSEDKTVNGLNEIPILLESVFGVNVDSSKEDGILWDDIEKARDMLKEWKEKNNFIWTSLNLYDIILICYTDDNRKEMVVKVLKNTRLLQFKGLLHKKGDKLKLDTMDLSNFNTDLLSDLGYLDNTYCVLKCVKPIDRKYLKEYFNGNSYDSYVYDVSVMKGV